LEISLDLEEKEFGAQLGCWEYQNKLWTQMKKWVLASQTGRRHLTV